MTVEYDWHHVYSNAVEQFGGDTPSAPLEAELLEIFQQRPEDLITAINKIGNAYQQGRVQSPWGALKSEIARLRNRPHLIVSSGKAQAKKHARAEQWIRSAGQHFDRWAEVETVLRDDYGINNPDLLRPVWDEAREAGEQLERDAQARAAQWKLAQARLAEIAKQKRAELDAAQNFPASR